VQATTGATSLFGVLGAMKNGKSSVLSGELRDMIDVRHQAEQRGHFEPLGRLLSLDTAHGLIEFGIQNGEGAGPDLGIVHGFDLNCTNEDPLGLKRSGEPLLILGQWLGLPAIRKNSATPCVKCKRVCDVCAGTGMKLCEGVGCGGRGFVPGKFVSCPESGCHSDTGQFKPGCKTCGGSDVKGMIREQNICLMCLGVQGPDGFTIMKCSACRGSGKRSTGRVNGSLDYRLPSCKACGGTGWEGELVKQDVAKFTNSEIVSEPIGKNGPFNIHIVMLALGPIQSFTIKDFADNRIRTFGVLPDEQGDYLNLLVPKTVRNSPRCKAYLVGGVVREKVGQAA
jgi:hypothetical protein